MCAFVRVLSFETRGYAKLKRTFALLNNLIGEWGIRYEIKLGNYYFYHLTINLLCKTEKKYLLCAMFVFNSMVVIVTSVAVLFFLELLPNQFNFPL